MLKVLRPTVLVYLILCCPVSAYLHASDCPICGFCNFTDSRCLFRPVFQQILTNLPRSTGAVQHSFPELHLRYSETDWHPLINPNPYVPGITDNTALYTAVMLEYSEIIQQLRQQQFHASFELNQFIKRVWLPAKQQCTHLQRGTDEYNQFWGRLYLSSKSRLVNNFRIVVQVSEALFQLGYSDKAIMLLRIIEYNHPNMAEKCQRVLLKQQAFILGMSTYYFQCFYLYMQVYPKGGSISQSVYSLIRSSLEKIYSLLPSEKQTEAVRWFHSLNTNSKPAENSQWQECSYIK